LIPIAAVQERTGKDADVFRDMKAVPLGHQGEQSNACLNESHPNRGCGWCDAVNHGHQPLPFAQESLRLSHSRS
jgi:hypothetical protein